MNCRKPITHSCLISASFALVSYLLPLSVGSANAQSVNATVDVDIEVPNILVVRYVDDVTFQPTATDLGFTSDSVSETFDASGAGFTLSPTGAIPTAGIPTGGTYTGTVENALAVWTNAASFSINSLQSRNDSGGSAVLAGPSGAGTSSILLSSPSFTGISTTGRNFSFPLSFANARLGDLTFSLDLSNAVEAGTYSSGSADDISYTISVP